MKADFSSSSYNNEKEITLEAIKTEYEYEVDKTAKIDNKINIALTFSVAIFAFVIQFLNYKNYLFLRTDMIYKILFSILYIVISIVNIALSSWIIISLLKLIKPTQYKRVDCIKLLQNAYEDINSENHIEQIKFLSYLLADYAHINRDINNKRMQKLQKIFFRLPFILLCILILNIIKINYK